jgi:hypothetical protein
MRTKPRVLAGLAAAALFSAVAFAQAPQQPPPGGQGGRPGGQGGRPGGQGAPAGPPTFFITSVGKGDGANLGGLAGADAHCAMLAQAAGLMPGAGRTWRAYLSASAAGGQPAVNARDRIGAGPWYNGRGQLIANNVADLHGDVQRDRNSINKNFALTEKGTPVNGVGDMPNQHDMLTGSDSTGRLAVSATGGDTTCSNWTSNASPPAGAARGTGPGALLGHHDRIGGGNTSWNSAHGSAGCSQENLVQTGGNGLFYCFAAN